MNTFKKFAPQLLSFIGGIYFFRQAIFYAQHMGSIIDEGAYLVRGTLFASGTYGMFTPYGPATNHMPLAFLPYGFFQEWFGPGLWEARVFAIVLGVVGLIGLWSFVRWNWGDGWAAVAVWAITLNPVLVQMYSQAVSQVFVFALFTWTMALGVGKKRKNWQLMIAGVLAALIYLTRINMAPVFPLLAAYIFWRHGKRIGWRVLGLGIFTIFVFHLLFYPGLFLFEVGLFNKYVPFVSIPAPSQASGGIGYWSQNASNTDRIASLLVTTRSHFLNIFGGVIALISAWFVRKQIRKRDHLPEATLIFSLLLSLFVIHAYVSMFSTHCIYCLPSYTGFYSFLGIVLLVIVFQSAGIEKHRWLAASLVLIIITGLLGGALYQGGQNASALIRPIYNAVPTLQRLNNLMGVMASRLNVPYTFETGVAISLMIGIGTVMAIILLGLRLVSSKIPKSFDSPFRNALYLATIIGIVLTPTRLLGGIPVDNFCGRKTTASYDAAGEFLAEYIPSGSRVLWYTSISAAPLLHLREVELFHPTINSNYLRYIGGDADLINSRGAWNEETALAWVETADYILLSDATLGTYGGSSDLSLRLVEAADMELLDTTERVVDCRIFSPIYIYGKVE